MKWTKEQSEAIKSRNSNLLVAAAAGSGKTAVLVERIIGRIIPEDENYDEKDYTDIDRLMVVTFTNAAAAELRERIDKAIDKRLEHCSSARISERLYRQKALLSKSFIMTIDAFCLNVVKQNFVQCGIDPAFSIGDKNELDILEKDVLDDILERHYAEKNPAFYRAVETYSDKTSDSSFAQTIMNIYKFAQNDAMPEAWIEEQKERFSDPDNFDFWNSVWGKEACEYLFALVKDSYEEYCELQMLCAEHGIESYQKTIDSEADALGELIKKIETGNYKKAFENSAETLFQAQIEKRKKHEDSFFGDIIKNRRNNIKKRYIAEYNSFFAGSSPEEQIKILSEDIKCICNIVKEFQHELKEEKYRKRIYSFSDISHFALDLLVKDCRKEGLGFVPTDIAVRFQRQFDEIYIDEYQDTSLIQEIMLNSVSGRGCNANNVFMVGDIKQSIYGFRHACPDIFLKKYNTYEESGSDNRLICLYANFRSRKNVVDGVNCIFSKIMKKSTADMDYTEKEYLNYGAKYYSENEKSAEYDGQKCELILIGKKESKDYSEHNIASDIEVEARFIAGKIIEMINSGHKVFDTSIQNMRPVRFSDIAVLLRKNSGVAPVFAEVLASYAIPVFTEAKGGFFASAEISTVLSFIKVIDNPYQDVALMSVMRSPIYCFTDSDISLLRLQYKKTDLYTACKLFSAGEYSENYVLSELNKKIKSFMDRLEELRKLSGMLSVYDLIWILVNENDFYNKLALFENGESRQANIRMLLDNADSFDNSGGQGLFKFIRNMQRLENEGKDFECASVCSESANVVRVMTIHKSKGLEFPVVFLAAADKNFNLETDKGTVLIHKTLGINPICYEKGNNVSITYPSVMRNVAMTVINKEQKAEEMRLLYVAMTRAREKFYAVGIGDEKIIAVFEETRCNSYNILQHKNYRDWLLMSIGDSKSWEKYVVERENAFKYPDEASREYLPLPEKDIKESDFSYTEKYDADNGKINSDGGTQDNLIIPVKISVSDIKRIHSSAEEDSEISDLFSHKQSVVMKKITVERKKDGKKKLSPAEKGTLIHTCLQLLDLKKCKYIVDASGAEEYIKSFLEELKNEKIFSADEVDAVETGILVKFILSDIGKRVFNAEKVYRETPFTISMSWSEISGNDTFLVPDENVSVQGIIDCFIVEDDGCIVIDYKTDYLRQETAASIDEAYQVQIKCYCNAIERITGKKVKESKIVYLRNL